MRRMANFFLLLAAAGLVVVHGHVEQVHVVDANKPTEPTDVLVIGDDNFDAALAASPMLLEFYAPVSGGH